MCRFVAYLGKPIIVDELLFKPSNSLIRQSMHAKESDIILNGDGFGLGWYAHEIDYTPGLFTSVLPAWNDRNLMYLAAKIRTNCVLAHVRAASAGGVSIFNCHPFHFQRFLFMHNGSIGGFNIIKRHLRRQLSDSIYDWIKGQTDSEHFFALFLQVFIENGYEHTAENMTLALKATLQRIFELQQTHKIDEPTYLNSVMTNGLSLVATRFSSEPEKYCSSLHYSAGSQYEFHNGTCHMHPAENGQNEAILIASEKLNHFNSEWVDIPVNHALIVHQDLSLKVAPLT